MTEYICLKDNQIHLLGKFDHVELSLLRQVFESAKRHCAHTIDIHICSPGGLMSELDKIVMLIVSAGKPVHAYIHNLEYFNLYSGVASAASVLVSYCNQVFIDPDATFMIHHSRQFVGKKIKIIKDEDDVYYWMQKTDQSYDTIKNLVYNEIVFDSTAAKNLGFVHMISDSKYVIPIGNLVDKSIAV